MTLEQFLYPKKSGDNSKKNRAMLKTLSRDVMARYYCNKHNMIFWRNIIDKNGKCSLCGFYNKIYHVPLNEDIYKEIDNMAWEEEEGMNFIDWEKTKEIVGRYKEKLENFGENNSNVYVLETEDGKIISIWGTGFLDTKMANVSTGSRIRIVYEGLGKATKKGFNPPKLFKVFVDR